MKTRILILIISVLIQTTGFAVPPCSPLGDQISFGSSNTWIGYVYQGKNFDTYKGYVNEGNVSSPNFDESFGGDQTTYNTNGCSIFTDTFSVRYKLTQSFVDADYIITVGGDDGYRLSLDGGATWVVNKWFDQGYATTTYNVHLNGSYNLVYEFYENFGGNRTSFNIVKSCTGSGNPAIYGTNNTWIGYIYSGTAFNTYKGYVNEGNSMNPNFDESFGGDYVSYGTSDCPINTDGFSARYRLQKTFTNGTYQIIIGGDDGYRLSFDGGSTWAINRWNDQSYTTTTLSTVLNGTYSMVLEYYENGGQNRISFDLSGGTILPLNILSFDGQHESSTANEIRWKTSHEVNVDYFTVQRSTDGTYFQNLGQVASQSSNQTGTLNYVFTDHNLISGSAYYRLEIKNKDGQNSYSSIIKLNNNAAQETRIFPTVVRDGNIVIETAKTIRNAKLEIYDLSGKKMSETNWESLSGKVNTNIGSKSAMVAGTYVARLTANGENLQNQLIIVQTH